MASWWVGLAWRTLVALLLTALIAPQFVAPMRAQTLTVDPATPTRLVPTPSATVIPPTRQLILLRWSTSYDELLAASAYGPTLTPTAMPSLVPTAMLRLPTDGVTRTLRVPILMYHYVSTPPDPTDALRVDLSVRPERLAEQLEYLDAQGYTSISLDDLALSLTTGAPLPPKPVILTFDDGHRDHYEHAFPLLRAFGYTGTFFVVTSFIDQGRPEYLTWDQVSEMHAAGMRIESHAYTHVDLRARDVDYLVWQMLGSKEAIEARTGRPVRFFCYPAGHYDDLAMRVLDSANYWGATTILHGDEHRSGQLFELRRVRVRGSYRLAQFAALLKSDRVLGATPAPTYALSPARSAPTASPTVALTPTPMAAPTHTPLSVRTAGAGSR